ncbi:hydroxysqualene dehydroxylase HpnE [Ottowia sp.]|uniref:hydroxysqualene dehydroxylase HpnE n=1 Tax=Ottowia sp. TaxID=1898956 RepID=UPI0025FB4EF0|nr:hydroxysqualene dehydroxylase HpnE [Ottowia sp.]MBK6747092.1 FAD-dependent oxidoreductase [Ottowia sp.]
MNPSAAPPARVAIVGAGWAGLAAAVRAVQDSHHVTVFEAARHLGGRARGLPLRLPDGRELRVDNGQHILIGAYTDSLRLMRTVGVDPAQVLLRRPLALQFPDGSGLRLPDWPAPLDAAAGILAARGWPWRDKLALLRAAAGWRRAGFACAATATVADLCADLPPRLIAEFIEPLCVSALNTPMAQASGQVFLRVLRDALLGPRGGSNLLLPRIDLGALFPEAAARWLEARGARVLTGQRIDALRWQPPHWHAAGQAFDCVIIATSAPNAAKTLIQSALDAPDSAAYRLRRWSEGTARLAHRAITTVYARTRPAPAGRALLHSPMVALRSAADAPAQFVFDRDAIVPPGPPTGLLAFVVSDSSGERADLEAAITRQALRQLGLRVEPLLTLTEKRATFACTPALARPALAIAPGLRACGDYVDGPYPATLEGAVRSGWQAAADLHTAGLESPPQAGVVQW